MIRLWYKNIKELLGMFINYPVSAFAAQTTFFLIISAFPFVMLLISLIGFFPLVETDYLQNELCRILPDLLDGLVNKVFNEIEAGGNLTLISVVALSALFAASKGFVSLIRGLNMVYDIKEQRNYFAVRLMAIGCTGSIILAIVLTLVIMVFGDRIVTLVTHLLPGFAQAAVIISSFRALFIFVVLTLLFLLLYLWVPNRRSTFRRELPGAMFSALGWIVFSLLYSIYLNHVNTYIYGSLAAAVFIMLWLYFCIYILFVGAELNQFLHLIRSQQKGE